MSKKIAKVVGMLAAVVPSAVLASDLTPGARPARISGSTDIQGVVVQIINWFLGFVGLVAVVMFIYGGILYLSSGGQEENTGKAKKAMLYAVIGIIIVLLAYTIVAAFTDALTTL